MSKLTPEHLNAFRNGVEMDEVFQSTSVELLLNHIKAIEAERDALKAELEQEKAQPKLRKVILPPTEVKYEGYEE